MIGKDRKVDAFYNDMCNVLQKKKAWPDMAIFNLAAGRCRTCGSLHDWSVVHEIATTFWECGGDIDADWKRLVEVHGFDADELQEIMLGVFIGGDRPDRNRRPHKPSYTPYTMGTRP